MLRVLSLFDGISCARVALTRAGVIKESRKRNNNNGLVYFSSEIDKQAMSIAEKNYPNTIQLGDVRTVTRKSLGHIDLLIGGSPCQDLSVGNTTRSGLNGVKSGLFFEYIRLLKDTRPTFFILENVASMSDKDRNIITKTIGVKPIMINASLVSAQNRKRLFWTNISVKEMPRDRGIVIRDILHHIVDEKYFLNTKEKTIIPVDGRITNGIKRIGVIGTDYEGNIIYSENHKAIAVTKSKGCSIFIKHKNRIRRLMPIECERLQSLPDNYTAGVSDTARYQCIGNAFNVDVIAHILKWMRK